MFFQGLLLVQRLFTCDLWDEIVSHSFLLFVLNWFYRFFASFFVSKKSCISGLYMFSQKDFCTNFIQTQHITQHHCRVKMLFRQIVNINQQSIPTTCHHFNNLPLSCLFLVQVMSGVCMLLHQRYVYLMMINKLIYGTFYKTFQSVYVSALVNGPMSFL